MDKFITVLRDLSAGDVAYFTYREESVTVVKRLGRANANPPRYRVRLSSGVTIDVLRTALIADKNTSRLKIKE